jgi:hypothetical protein
MQGLWNIFEPQSCSFKSLLLSKVKKLKKANAGASIFIAKVIARKIIWWCESYANSLLLSCGTGALTLARGKTRRTDALLRFYHSLFSAYTLFRRKPPTVCVYILLHWRSGELCVATSEREREWEREREEPERQGRNLSRWFCRTLTFGARGCRGDTRVYSRAAKLPKPNQSSGCEFL